MMMIKWCKCFQRSKKKSETCSIGFITWLSDVSVFSLFYIFQLIGLINLIWLKKKKQASTVNQSDQTKNIYND